MRLDADVFLDVLRVTPLVSIDLILRDGAGRVLLGMRRNEPARGMWFVPGGRICKDERLDAALGRICRTELGPQVEPGSFRFKGAYEHLYPTNFAGVDGVTTHYVVLAYEGTVGKRERVEPDSQHEAFKWFEPADAAASDTVHAYTKAYLEG